ncbi:MAG: carboxypeptidase M32 [Halolamina sp.]
MSTDQTPEAYDDLLDRYRTVQYLGDAAGVLSWDQQVVMPEGGNPARAKQQSAVSEVSHDLLTDEAFAEALQGAEAAVDDLTDDQRANVREIRESYDRAAPVPGELVAELTEFNSESQQVWQTAKAEDDFERFAPRLRGLRDLQVERARHINPDQPPYEVMYEDTESFLPLPKLQDIFEELKDGLGELIDRIESEGDELPSPFAGDTYDEANQEALSEHVLDVLGYDRDHGRLDTSPHPFTSGTQFDARVTTRYKEDDPLDALTATIHEFGHATYMLGLPRERYGEPLGNSLDSGVHESQSRFWENHVGRTKPFWELITPDVRDHLDGVDDLTAEEAYQAANRIYPNNCIRVEADELTYHMHIILRSEIGQAFVAGDIDAEDIPRVWNEKMEEYLGVVPETDSEGCLQDIHWTGRFAAFQGYTIGSVLAAQLDAAMREEVDDVDERIRAGEFGPLREWMEKNVHAHGRKYGTDELAERATGEPLTAEYFLDYVEEKFTDLYDL